MTTLRVTLRVLAVTCVLLRAATCQKAVTAPVPTEEYPLDASLDADDVYHMYWRFDQTHVTFEVHVRTLGWVGLGFTYNGRMEGSDIVVGWKTANATFFKDCHALSYGPPVEDVSPDYSLDRLEETDGFTIIKFTRKIETCDSQDHNLEGTVHVIYAWHEDDPAGDELDWVNKHQHRGSKELLLLSKPNPAFNPDNYAETFMLQDEVLIPTTRTYYHCRYYTFPATDPKRHVVRFAAVVQDGHEKYIHHLAVFRCSQVVEDVGNGIDCDDVLPTEDNPTNGDDCWTEMIYAWAVGQGAFVLPDDVGFPWGGDGQATTYKLQIHYDNPDLDSGVLDSSGIVMHQTDTLRRDEAGLLNVGQIQAYPALGVNIPPGMTDFHMHSYCGSCSDLIPAGGVRVFASTLHAHTAGRGLWTRHVRDGTELPHLGKDPNYDFNFQALRVFHEERLVLPGDDLITTCVYDTVGRQTVTITGEGTDQEMCSNFLYYYPRMDLAGCLSHVQLSQKWFPLIDKRAQEGAFGPNYTAPGSIKPDEASYFAPYLDFDEETQILVREMEEEGGFMESCMLAAGSTFPDTGSPYQFAYEPVFPAVEETLEEHQCRDNPDKPDTSRASGVTSHLAAIITGLVTLIMA